MNFGLRPMKFQTVIAVRFAGQYQPKFHTNNIPDRRIRWNDQDDSNFQNHESMSEIDTVIGEEGTIQTDQKWTVQTGKVMKSFLDPEKIISKENSDRVLPIYCFRLKKQTEPEKYRNKKQTAQNAGQCNNLLSFGVYVRFASS
jgi:hypothetical protein